MITTWDAHLLENGIRVKPPHPGHSWTSNMTELETELVWGQVTMETHSLVMSFYKLIKFLRKSFPPLL